MRRLPPFDALVAFDSALRHRSVTRAAGELGVTQSAVSHRLRRLESFVGAPLLYRTSEGLSATATGEALATGLTELLDGLADLRARCRAAIAPASLRVGIGPALAHHWLVRRLAAFTAAHPAIEIELVIVEGEIQTRLPDVDVEIRWLPVDAARQTSTQRMLFQERVFPVCHPRLLPNGRSLRDPKALASLPLLHKGPAGRGGGAEWSWPVWFERLGISTRPPSGLRFGTLGTAISAALEGAGVVLARSLLVHDALVDGRLVRVLPPTWEMASSKVHVVRWPAALGGDERVRRFVAWVAAEAKATVGRSRRID
ncbi:MAG: LysR family transcriptional regulator [Proteobacteria bacterium]|nr:LysR family transcriptional regulator [Pseudomonadota bacterium]